MSEFEYGGYIDPEDDDCSNIIKGTFVHSTEKAVLLNHRGMDVWLPVSEISTTNGSSPTNHAPGDELELYVPVWLCEKNSLE